MRIASCRKQVTLKPWLQFNAPSYTVNILSVFKLNKKNKDILRKGQMNGVVTVLKVLFHNLNDYYIVP